MMKRIVSLTLVVLMVAALFVGCSSNSPAGKYKVKSVNGDDFKTYLAKEANKETLDADTEKLMLDTFKVSSIDEIMTMEIKDDNSFTMNMMGQEATGTWKLDGEKLTLTVDNDASDCTFKGGEITMEVSDDMKVVFAK